MDTIKKISWTGLYRDSWKGEIVDEAFSHPAKYSRALIRKIYQHMLDRGWLKPGDKVIDPFGGVALGGYHALQFGLHWTGCELEEKFVQLGNENIDLWNGRYSQHFERWGTVALLQGDSRNLSSILAGQVDGGLSSPPYANDTVHGRNGIDLSKTQRPGKNSQAAKMAGYGGNTGQLSAMKEGDFDTAVSSPAYADTVNNGDGPGVRHDPKTHKGDNAHKATSQAAYGASDGQLGGMSAGDWDAAVSSSPYEASLHLNESQEKQIERLEKNGNHSAIKKMSGASSAGNQGYDNSPGQLGKEEGPTFWTAAREIVEQTYIVLKPGAYVAFVCGDFVRQGKRVHFGRQWMELCEAVGFVPVEWATAWKREPGPVQTGIFGDVDKTIDRVSFFRRLANQRNPDNAILNEDVIFMRKPL